jgi:hypothetical protein
MMKEIQEKSETKNQKLEINDEDKKVKKSKKTKETENHITKSCR